MPEKSDKLFHDMGLFIGTSGYNYHHWQGSFYPERMDAKKMFQFYSARFDTVEVNYTFYHTPGKTTMRNWYGLAPLGFKYTLKVPRTITHLKKLKDCKELIKNFDHLASLLKERCGMVLFQMPPSFHLKEENLKKLEETFRSLNKDLGHAIEFRHNSWFDSEETVMLCQEYKVAFCIVSAPGIRFKNIRTSGNVYVRLHGKDKWYHHDYSEEELRELASLIREHLEQGTSVWVYFNNDFNAFAPMNALLLKKMLEQDVPLERT